MNQLSQQQAAAREEWSKANGYTIPFDMKVLDEVVARTRQSTLDAVEAGMPKAMQECDCEEDGFGYHSKDCDFRPQGFNQCRAAVLSHLKALRDLT